MKVLFFAQARQAAGCAETSLSLAAPVDAAGLWQELEKHFPKLSPLRASTRLARNCSYAGAEEIFHDEDEVALIPPVSGG